MYAFQLTERRALHMSLSDLAQAVLGEVDKRTANFVFRRRKDSTLFKPLKEDIDTGCRTFCVSLITKSISLEALYFFGCFESKEIW